MAKEKEPLHELILRIIYVEHPKRPQPMTTEDVLWKIDDPKVMKHQVKEVLDWLVNKRELEVSFGKYQLDRIKFLELKAQYGGVKVKKKKIVSYPKRKERRWSKLIMFLLPILIIGFFVLDANMQLKEKIFKNFSFVDNKDVAVESAPLIKETLSWGQNRKEYEKEIAKRLFNQYQNEIIDIRKQNEKLWITLLITSITYSFLFLIILKR